MKQLLISVFLILSSVCQGQTKVYPIIDFKDTKELKGLLYFKADTTLVTGRVIQYNKKMIEKRSILVTNGVPEKSGWIKSNIVNIEYINKIQKQPMFDKRSYLEWKQQQPFDEIDRKRFNENNERARYLKLQNNYLIQDSINANQFVSYKYFNEDLDLRENSIDSIKDGYFEIHYPYGPIIKSKENYINGKKEGLWQEYYINGQLIINGYYIEGKKDGIWEEYFNNGQLRRIINYIDGKEDGLLEVYHENGKLLMKGSFEDGIQKGEWNYYDENGTLTKTENFDD